MTMVIGLTKKDPEVQGNNEPSGRMNLKGQQKSDELIAAENEETRTHKVYTKAIDAYEDNPCGLTKKDMQTAEHLYAQAWEKLKLVQNHIYGVRNV